MFRKLIREPLAHFLFLGLLLFLLFFNVGVEIGQLLFIAAVLTLVTMASRLLRDDLDPRWTVVMPAYLIGGIASYWVVERTAAFWQ